MGYILRDPYRPALVPTCQGEEYYSALTFEGLSYPAFPNTFSPGLNAETPYRRAPHELQVAEEESSDITLNPVRQAADLREQGAYRERRLAIQPEVERVEGAHGLPVKLARDYELHDRAHQVQAALDRRPCQKVALLHAFDANDKCLSVSERPSAKKRRLTHSEPTRHPVLRASEVTTFDSLLKLFSWAHSPPHSPLQQSCSPAPSQPRSAGPQLSEKPDAAADSLRAVLEFIHSLASHANDLANGPETIPKVRHLSFVRIVDFRV